MPVEPHGGRRAARVTAACPAHRAARQRDRRRAARVQAASWPPDSRTPDRLALSTRRERLLALPPELRACHGCAPFRVFATSSQPAATRRSCPRRRSRSARRRSGAQALDTAGQGVKIGIIDSGIDAGHPFFDPTGYAMPAGFPKGQERFTTAKVIVARRFRRRRARRRERARRVLGRRLQPRHARRRYRSGERGHAGRRWPAGLGCRAARVPRELQGVRRDGLRAEPRTRTRLRSWPRSRPPSPTGWTCINFSGGEPEIEPQPRHRGTRPRRGSRSRRRPGGRRRKRLQRLRRRLRLVARQLRSERSPSAPSRSVAARRRGRTPSSPPSGRRRSRCG